MYTLNFYFRYQGRCALYWAVVTDNEDMLDLLLSDMLWQFDLDQLAMTSTNTPTPPLHLMNNRLQTAATARTNSASTSTGWFGLCPGGSSSGTMTRKRTASDKQRAKVERALNGALFEAACHASARCVLRAVPAYDYTFNKQNVYFHFIGPVWVYNV